MYFKYCKMNASLNTTKVGVKSNMVCFPAVSLQRIPEYFMKHHLRIQPTNFLSFIMCFLEKLILMVYIQVFP